MVKQEVAVTCVLCGQEGHMGKDCVEVGCILCFARGHQRQEEESSGAVTSRVTRSSRNSSRAGTPQNGSTGRNGGQSRRNVSLMTHSETEEGSEEDEEEEEDIEEEEEEEDESGDEEEVNGVDRVDLAVQTSLMDSPSPTRFRGQRLANTNYSSTTPTTGYSTTPTFPIMSP